MIENRDPRLHAAYVLEDKSGGQVGPWTYQRIFAFSDQGDALVLDMEAGRLIPAKDVTGFREVVSVSDPGLDVHRR